MESAFNFTRLDAPIEPTTKQLWKEITLIGVASSALYDILRGSNEEVRSKHFDVLCEYEYVQLTSTIKKTYEASGVVRAFMQGIGEGELNLLQGTFSSLMKEAIKWMNQYNRLGTLDGVLREYFQDSLLIISDLIEYLIAGHGELISIGDKLEAIFWKGEEMKFDNFHAHRIHRLIHETNFRLYLLMSCSSTQKKRLMDLAFMAINGVGNAFWELTGLCKQGEYRFVGLKKPFRPQLIFFLKNPLFFTRQWILWNREHRI